MNRNPRIVDVKALMKCVLEMWKGILLLAVVAALLLGGMKGFKTYKSMKAPAQESTSEGTTSGDVAEADEQAITTPAQELSVVNKAIENRNEYIANSIKMQIDPYHEGRATVDVIVEVENTETEEEPASEVEISETTTETSGSKSLIVFSNRSRRENNILGYYMKAADSRIDFTALADEMGTKPVYLEELVTIPAGSIGSNKATIQVIYPDEAGAQRILEYVIEQLSAASVQAQTEYEAHTVKFVNRSVSTEVDKELYPYVNSRLNEVNGLYSGLDQLKGSIGTGAGSTSDVQTGMKDVAKAFVKYAIAGFVGATFGLAFLYAVILLLMGTVLSGRELNTQYSLCRIACIPSKRRTKAKGLDKLIASIDGGYYSNDSIPESYMVANTAVTKMAAAGSRIALISDLPEEYLGQVAERLQKLNGRRRIEYVAISCEEETAENINAFSACDAAVLVAARKKSTYRKTEDILEMARRYEKAVIGSIVIG